MSKSYKRQYKEFLEYLLRECDVGSNIGLFWLENLCKEQLVKLGKGNMRWIKMTQMLPPDDLWWRWVYDTERGVTIARWWPGPNHWGEVYNTDQKEYNILPNVTHYGEIDWPERPSARNLLWGD